MLNKTLIIIATVKKFLVALAGGVAQIVALGVLSGKPLAVAQSILAVATALGVYGVRNV